MIIEHITSTFHATLYSPIHLYMSFIDRHILMLTIATYIQLWHTKYQSDRGMNYNLKNYAAVHGRSQKWVQQ
jgi:hypothetical protein